MSRFASVTSGRTPHPRRRYCARPPSASAARPRRLGRERRANRTEKTLAAQAGPASHCLRPSGSMIAQLSRALRRFKRGSAAGRIMRKPLTPDDVLVMGASRQHDHARGHGFEKSLADASARADEVHLRGMRLRLTPRVGKPDVWRREPRAIVALMSRVRSAGTCREVQVDVRHDQFARRRRATGQPRLVERPEECRARALAPATESAGTEEILRSVNAGPSAQRLDSGPGKTTTAQSCRYVARTLVGRAIVVHRYEDDAPDGDGGERRRWAHVERRQVQLVFGRSTHPNASSTRMGPTRRRSREERVERVCRWSYRRMRLPGGASARWARTTKRMQQSAAIMRCNCSTDGAPRRKRQRRSVSRVLCPERVTQGDGHFSRTPVARRLKRPNPRARTGRPIALLFGLAPGGVCLADAVTRAAGELLPHRFTLTASRRRSVSVALSVGSPPLAVSQHPALRSPDFPPVTRSDRRPSDLLWRAVQYTPALDRCGARRPECGRRRAA